MLRSSSQHKILNCAISNGRSIKSLSTALSNISDTNLYATKHKLWHNNPTESTPCGTHPNNIDYLTIK